MKKGASFAWALPRPWEGPSQCTHMLYILILKSTHVICVFVYVMHRKHTYTYKYKCILYIYIYILQLVKTKSSSTSILHEEAIRVNQVQTWVKWLILYFYWKCSEMYSWGSIKNTNVVRELSIPLAKWI